MATETEYVDAGEAVDFRNLSPGYSASAPPVAKGVNYDRILKGRDAEPHNWLTYYGAYDGQRYSPLDQINTSQRQGLTPAWVFQCGSVGMHSGASTYSFEASPLVVDGDHVSSPAGMAGSGRWTPRRERSCGATTARPRMTCGCAAATSTAGAPWPTGRSS